MNYYRFLNSKDVHMYLEAMEYQFFSVRGGMGRLSQQKRCAAG